MAKSKKSVPKAVKVPEISKYTIEIYMGGRKDKQTGTTIYEALSKLKFQKCVGVVSLVASNGERTTKAMFLRPIFFRRALESNSVKTVLASRIKKFLGE